MKTHQHSMRINKKQVLGSLFLSGFLSFSNAAEFSVDKIFDGIDATPGDGVCATISGDCTLRAAVMETNALAGADIINLPAGTYTLALGNTGEDLAAEGDLDILDDVTIIGDGPDTTKINGNAFKYRVFSVLKRVDKSLPVVLLTNMTLTQGVSGSNGAVIYNTGDLTLDKVTITDASLDSRAVMSNGNLTLKSSLLSASSGGISITNGLLTITDSEFSNNISTGSGAAIYLKGNTINAVISNTLFSANKTAPGDKGGAIYQFGYPSTLIIDNCQFTENQARYGGAIYAYGNTEIVNSSFDSNKTIMASTAGYGGALYLDSGKAGIIDSVFSNNISSNHGGGIYVKYADLRIKRTTLTGNTTTYPTSNGGGIYMYSNSIAEFSENIIRNNTAANAGGGLALRGYDQRLLAFSEVSGNTAKFGGGIYVSGDSVILENITISGNTATINGGGVYMDDGGGSYKNGILSPYVLELTHVTIANNDAPFGAISNLNNKSGAIRLGNMLLSAPAGDINCGGSIISAGYNLSSDASCGFGAEGDQVNTDPLLNVLADNGGFTQTMSLQATSPAIDMGNSALCVSHNSLDQRYNYRDANCDIGAFEADSVRALSGTLAFSVGNIDIGEADTTVTVTVSRTGGSEGAVSVSVYDTKLGTASESSSGSNNDYAKIPDTKFEWVDGDSADKTFDINIFDDTAFEGDETIALAFSRPSFIANGVSMGTGEATITIIDNEIAGEIQFSSAAYTIAEDGSYIDISVERINGNTAVSIDYATGDNTAVAGTDYTSVSGSLSFATGVTTRTFRVYITDNALVEGNKSINLTLSNPQSGLTLGSPVASTITIEEDDLPAVPGEISIENSVYSVNESDGSVVITLSRANGSDGAVSVSVSLVDGTALSGSDYSASSSSTVTFADGQISANWTVNIMDDMDVETDESFSIELSSATNGASIMGTSSATVTISDNDTANGGGGTGSGNTGGTGNGGSGTGNTGGTGNAGELQFADTGLTVNEADGTVTLTVSRIKGSSGSVTVNYVAYVDPLILKPALINSDYSLAAGKLTFADGEMSKTITFSIINDTNVELDESFWIDLRNPTGGAKLNDNWYVNVTIIDDDTAQSGGSNNSGNTGSDSNSESGGALNPLFFMALLLMPVISRRKFH